MRVKFLQSIAGSGSPDGIQYPNFYFSEGFVGVVTDEDLAKAWVASGVCVEAEPEAQARPPKPEFAVKPTTEKAVAQPAAKANVVVPVVAVPAAVAGTKPAESVTETKS